ncbi:MAG: glycosyltransferase family 2 protein [Phycisphaeraceae bacterium]|nr:glycosyltransferase family 2 protein [Phycisphaeraceae bacterium]
MADVLAYLNQLNFHLDHPLIRWPLTLAYVIVLLLIAFYGLHRYMLVITYYRNRHKTPQLNQRFETLPKVTVQLPMFNEGNVAARVIDAACHMDYPSDRLQIQVVDDSTDESALIARQHCESWQKRGIDIQYVHRVHRKGYKAGALREAMTSATGEFIAIFDADFIPPVNFLKDTVHHFTNEKIGMVQARWGHLNREDTLLTRAQAIFLDGHFLIEHAARSLSGRWMNFNGTAGLWRRQAIDDAGGWEDDTLTEDMDLSYRSQMAGWQFLFLPDVICPAELPPEINAFKAQQHRWTKGGIQTGRKLLWKILTSNASFKIKSEAFFHLTSMTVYVYITLLAILFFPAFYVNMQPFESGTLPALLWGMTLFSLGTASAGTFYLASQKVQNRSVFKTALHLPFLMSLGIGIALNNTRGVIEALMGQESAFVRTPKYNTTDNTNFQKPIACPSIKRWTSWAEIFMGFYSLTCIVIALGQPRGLLSVPFLMLFAFGYFYVGFSSMLGQLRSRPQVNIKPLPA